MGNEYLVDENGLEYREEEAPPIRKIIAKRMTESKMSAPHFYLTIDVDASRLIQLREEMNEKEQRKYSFNDFLIKGCAKVLSDHPELNASFIDEKIRYYRNVNISLAVAIEGGLITPTIRDCDKKTIREISEESAVLVEKARKKRLRPREWMGGTFTLTNLGMFGIEEFIAIINPPQSMILAIGTIRKTPVVEGENIKIGNRMKMTLSCDHRVVDGAMGATFLSELKSLIESPESLIS